MSLFKDHFSAQSVAYSQYRPTYPKELFKWLAANVPSKKLAWDAGAGNGQAAAVLAEYFDRVIASEPSVRQMAQAQKNSKIEYRNERAEDCSLDDSCADLVTAAQALHWFDFSKFFDQARRVLKPQGILAFWCYEVFSSETAIDLVVDHLYRETLGSYWFNERRFVETGYADIEVPFEEIKTPEFEMTLDWNLNETIGYLGTWSALQKYREQNNKDPLIDTIEQLKKVWGNPQRIVKLSWPLKMRTFIKR